ncbi:hypothetical protein [Roseobacter sinensis]|uniref:Uncharacterized protein n=1 Tax=Roseobacter sinensis TaxID=2931391 RepID=A0ABT3B902_9RHOB|nr:hypothetical protein [Roseobacter sp. WL0113]MCV3270067.1 hypothetical protein [Roseobacter sp. WL0113]
MTVPHKIPTCTTANLFALAVSVMLTFPAIAQTAPPLDLEMRLDPATRENRFLAVVIDGPNGPRRIEASEWLRPELAGYAQAAAPIIVGLGVPAGPDTPITRGRPGRDALPSARVPGARRLMLVSDDLANSMLLNIADDVDGMTLTFPDGGLKNGPGPELLIAEASLPAGRVSGGCPGVPASGADAIIVSLPDQSEVTLMPEDFIDVGPAGPQVNYGTEEIGRADVRIETLEQLVNLDMRALATIDYFKVYSTVLDLADLGVPDGETVETIVLSSSGEQVETDNGPQLCWTADPILVVGLPPF